MRDDRYYSTERRLKLDRVAETVLWIFVLDVIYSLHIIAIEHSSFSLLCHFTFIVRSWYPLHFVN